MFLAKDVYLARLGARSVVLNLRRDRYIGLSEATTASLLALTAQTPNLLTRIDPQDEPVRRTLVERGILTDEPGESPVRRASRPTHSAWAHGVSTLPPARSAGAAAAAIMALTQTSISLRFRPLLYTIGWLRRQHGKLYRGGRRGDVGLALDIFAGARPWFPGPPVCRLDAPALCLYLWRRGIDADLIFGVRLDPFAAHCWTQIGACAVLEPYDAMHQYSPILVI